MRRKRFFAPMFHFTEIELINFIFVFHYAMAESEKEKNGIMSTSQKRFWLREITFKNTITNINIYVGQSTVLFRKCFVIQYKYISQ